MKNNIKDSIKTNHLKLLVLSAIIGICAGIISVLYRYALTFAEDISNVMYQTVSNNLFLLPILFILLCVMGIFIGMLIKYYSLISGSGIPQLKAEISGYLKNNWLSTLISKFLGGVIGIIGGLSLGREGPSIQLGASVANGISKHIHTNETEKRILLASGASAGLASAFNAPLAGVMFALEEIFKYFSTKVILATMVAAIFGDFVSKLFFGKEHVFNFNIVDTIPIDYYWLFIIMGIITGILGVYYNIILIKTQSIYKLIENKIGHYKMVIPFIIAGILGIIFPILLGSGHHIITDLNLETPIILLIVILLGKFLFSMISFGSGAPGGIFFPLLILGAIIGSIFAKIFIPLFNLNELLFYNFVIIAMSAYFTAIVRAPMTGIILMIEMTGSLEQLLPLIVTSAVAYIVAEKLHNEPIYETLLNNLLLDKGIHKENMKRTKILIEYIVNFDSIIENKKLKDLELDEKCLIISIRRGEHDITPNGNTTIKAGDLLTILTSEKYETNVREQMEELVIER